MLGHRPNEQLDALGETAAGIAHEISNPLASISALTQSVERKTEDPALKKKLRLIDHHIRRVNQIVRRMVNLASPPSSDWKLTSVNDLIESVIAIAQYDKRADSIEIVSDLESEFPPIWVMPGPLEQVFLNLVLNAVEALGTDQKQKSQTLSVTSGWTESEELAIVFQDNGPGIPSDVLPRVFEPFCSTKKRDNGTGLGLAVSLDIVKKHNGTILAENGSEQGARFTVVLPARTQPSTMAADA